MMLAVEGVACLLWLLYVFGGLCFALAGGQARLATLFAIISCPRDKVARVCETVNFSGVWAAVFVAGVMDCEEADLKTSPRSLQPWVWPLTRAPDSISRGLRLLGLWFTAIGCRVGVAIVRPAPLLCSFRVRDRTADSEMLGV